MKFKARLKRFILVSGALLAVQILTYQLFSHQQLERELLTGGFGALTQSATTDSAFVRDFFVTDCGNTLGVYRSHDLNNEEQWLKTKLGVTFIRFQKKEGFSWDDQTEQGYDLVYHTWTVEYDFWPLNWFFGATQHEELTINKKDHYHREVYYRWILFFWVKKFEFVQYSYGEIEVPSATIQHFAFLKAS